MITNCDSNISLNLTTDPCGGKRYDTNCVIDSNTYSLLELPSNSTQKEINENLILAIQSLIDRVTLLEAQIADHETRISNIE